MRVYELARQLGVSSKSLVTFIKEKVGIEIKSHMSVLNDDQIRLIEEKLPSKEKEKEKEKEKSKPKTKKTKEKKEERKEEQKEEKDLPCGDECKKEGVIEDKGQDSDISSQEMESVSSAEKPTQEAEDITEIREVEVEFPISVRQLCDALGVKVSDLLFRALSKKMMLNINSVLDKDMAEEVASWYGVILKEAASVDERIEQKHQELEKQNQRPRHPVVTLMGHVDHGKTSLLDYIRKSNITDKEYGGITQHIGAYVVETKFGKITFLDTPGHEAFTSMRARGANITDLVILVVAADDGVMPQTIEAINHAKAAEVPIVVAINKIDTPGADPDKVKRQLAEYGLMPEEWGGKTIMIPVSAKTGKGIDDLLEMVILEAEMLELKSNYNKPACGVVLEAQLHPFKGVLATFLVTSGKLKVGDAVIVGKTCGKVRSIVNDKGQRIKELFPAEAGQILGLEDVPEAGDKFFVVESEKIARQIAEERKEKSKTLSSSIQSVSLEEMFEQIQKGEEKELRLILKADVRGTLEAIKASVEKFSNDEVKIRFMHTGVGEVGYSDVLLAEASKAVIIGFNVSVNSRARKYAEEKKIEIRLYRIIYQLLEDLQATVEGMLEPIIKEVWMGAAEVRQVFRLSKAGTIAGSYVKKGKVLRGADAKLVRNGQVVWEGKISSLKRFKDDVKEVAEGYECGIGLENFSQIMVGDTIECYQKEKVFRRLKG